MEGVELDPEGDRLLGGGALGGVDEPGRVSDPQPARDRRQLGTKHGRALNGEAPGCAGGPAFVSSRGHSRFPRKTRTGGSKVCSAKVAPSADASACG